MNYSKRFRVKPGHKVKLADIDPNFHDQHESESSAKAEIAKYQDKLRDLQYLMYAEDKRALLICLQAIGCRRQGRNYPACHGGDEPAGLQSAGV